MNSSLLHRLRDHAIRLSGKAGLEEQLVFAFIALVPLKLTLAYIALIPALLLSIISGRFSRFSPSTSRCFFPLLFFFTSAAMSCVLGLNPLRSCLGIAGFVGAALVIPLVAGAVRKDPYKVCGALFAGSALAGIDSLRSRLFPDTPRLFLGDVTESGQLAVTTVLAVGTALSLATAMRRQGVRLPRILTSIGVGTIVLLLLIVIGFTPLLHPYLAFGLSLAALSALVWVSTRLEHLEQKLFLCCSVVTPLVIANLLFNLKRGPFVGVFVALVLLLFLHARKLVFPFIFASLLAVMAVEPVRMRFAHSLDHFFISGGRSVMWSIGGELSTRYPLGIGFKNSGFLRKFSTEIPPELRHFHNNALNVVVETGWISACLLLSWVIQLLLLAFRSVPLARHHKPLLRAVGCAVVSWQVAGLVEYNFGDKEVMLLVFTLVGLLAGLCGDERTVGPGERNR